MSSPHSIAKSKAPVLPYNVFQLIFNYLHVYGPGTRLAIHLVQGRNVRLRKNGCRNDEGNMTLRQKLALGVGGLLLVIAAVGIHSVLRFRELGRAVDVVLRENYESILCLLYTSPSPRD